MATNLLDKLLAAAQAHGAGSEPDHEIGDLQGILLSCWKQLTAEQQRAVYAEHEGLVTDWL